MYRFFGVILALLIGVYGEAAEGCRTISQPDLHTLDDLRLRIGGIRYVRHPIFDENKPEENNWLFRSANRLHSLTREETIARRLLFVEGDPFSSQKVAESERILRSENFLRDAHIVVERICGDRVFLAVHTYDVWTLIPSINFSRSGGKNSLSFNITENNLLGTGQSIQIARFSDVERTGTLFRYVNRKLTRFQALLDLEYQSNQDGFKKRLVFERPFFALDTKWSGGIKARQFDRTARLYFRGEESLRYQQDSLYQEIFFGVSEGLVAGETERWRFGVTRDDNQFDLIPGDPLSTAVPEDRHWRYPWIGYEWIQDRFVTRTNVNLMNRTEDFHVGRYLSLRLGISDPILGADRSAIHTDFQYHDTLYSDEQTLWQLGFTLSGQLSEDTAENTIASANTRYYHSFSENHGLFISVLGQMAEDLYLDSPLTLGGDNGLRGFPIKYQKGNRLWLLTMEERFYTPWSLWSLFDIGGAVFLDVGRAWFAHGDNGTTDNGVLADVGFGLRFVSQKAGTDKVVHIDFAFPIGADGDISDVQLLVKVKKHF